ncbi:TPM domain-containing protein [Bradyrhizobium sp. CAR08]
MRKYILTVALFLIAGAAAAFEIPTLVGRVNDNAKLLSDSEVAALVDRIKAFEGRTKNGAQIAVLTLPSLDGESIDKVRSDVFHAWHLGQAGKDNGLLVVIAPVERKVAIEVGYGLEAVIPDSRTMRIIDDRMKPNLKKGAEKWYVALDAAVEALASDVLASEEPPAPPSRPSGLAILAWSGVVGSMVLGLTLWMGAMSRRREQQVIRERAERASQDRLRAQRQALFGEAPSSRPRTTTGRPANVAGAAAVVAGVAAASSPRPKPKAAERRRSEDESYRSSSYSSSSDNSSSSSSSSSDSGFSGGGGDSGGGGSSTDF